MAHYLLGCLFCTALALFLVSFLFNLFGGGIAPSQRFEWEQKTKTYRYIEERPFLYIGKPLKWFPAKTKISYGEFLFDRIRIECVLLADKETSYTANLTRVYNLVPSMLQIAAAEIEKSTQRETYPEIQEHNSLCDEALREHARIVTILSPQGIEVERLIVKDRFSRILEITIE